MARVMDRKAIHRRIRFRIRRRISGSATRPRLAVFKSLKHIYVQAIDDDTGRTLAQASSLDKELRGKIKHGSDADAARQVGATIAGRLKQSGVDSVIFDRGGFVYHGRVKALADAARETGLKF